MRLRLFILALLSLLVVPFASASFVSAKSHTISMVAVTKPTATPKAPGAYFPDCVANGFMQIPACDDNGQHHLPPPASFCGSNQTEVQHIPLYDEFNATLAYADIFYSDNSVGCGALWIGILKESGICMTIEHINTIELTNPPSDGSRTVAQSSLPYNDCTDQSWFSTYILGIASDAGDLQCAYAGIVYIDEYNYSHTRNSNSYCATY